MDLQQKGPMDAARSSFPRFPDLPIEIQFCIWEFVLCDSSYIRTEWTTPHLTTLWPLVSIPELGEADKPGLIPFPLPAGMPTTMTTHPPPWGFPDRQQVERTSWPDFHDYRERMIGISRNGILDATSSSLRSTGAEVHTPAVCFVVCRASRQQAMRHVIGATEQSLRCENAQDYSGNRLYPVRNGFVFGTIFKAQRNRKPVVVYAIAPNADDPELPSRIGQDFLPGINTHVAARLSDIERCIFGRRLSLTVLPEGMDGSQFRHRAWLLWWRPQLGFRARRPEANHPFHCPPGSILWIYSMVLHHLVGARAEDFPRLPECLAGSWDAGFHIGDWYFTLIREGKCQVCRRPLIQDLQSCFPELIDSDGYVDIVIIRDRNSVENPEGTIKNRSHEIFV
ncbi:hypothetical protein F4677DRAFT_91154 [Hypoxylon crocopeplum]|nr:hypothetical protein F4677DRAFT_91154 [Hypoxylon crocopeplum]